MPETTVKAHDSAVTQLQWNNSGTLLASASEDMTIKIFTSDEPIILEEHKESVLALSWSNTGPGTPNNQIGQMLASGSKDQTIKIWDAESGKCLQTLKKHLAPVTSLAFSPTNNYLDSGDSEGTLILWSLVNFSPHRIYESPSKVRFYCL